MIIKVMFSMFYFCKKVENASISLKTQKFEFSKLKFRR